MWYMCERCKQMFKAEEDCRRHEETCGPFNTRVTILVSKEDVTINKSSIPVSECDRWWNKADCCPYKVFDGGSYQYKVDYWEDEHTEREAMLELVKSIRGDVAKKMREMEERKCVLDSFCRRADELEKKMEEP